MLEQALCRFHRCRFMVACGCVLLLSGCAVVGPESIRSGRLAYNESIKETNNQQILMVMVHNRYDETYHMLAVSSVTANVRVTSRIQIEAGVGSSDNYEGNLVPFSGGFVYEENPTISYRPVSGEAYLREITSALPISLMTKVTHSMPYPEATYAILLSSVNDIDNPQFLYEPQQDDPRFDRFLELMTELTRRHCARWGEVPGMSDRATLILQPGSESCGTPARALLELLAVQPPALQEGRWVIPVYQRPHAQEPGSIAVNTRSVWQLVEILSGAVEVPQEDEESGVAARFPRPGRAGRTLRIRFAESRPDHATVAVQYRGGWFYIDNRDSTTKRYFMLLNSLWSAVMAHSLDPRHSTPVLTVPVSR